MHYLDLGETWTLCMYSCLHHCYNLINAHNLKNDLITIPTDLRQRIFLTWLSEVLKAETGYRTLSWLASVADIIEIHTAAPWDHFVLTLSAGLTN